MNELKILSWNINGLKSTLQPYGDINVFMKSLDSDIICFQETKLPVLNESRLCITEDYYRYALLIIYTQSIQYSITLLY